MHAHWCCPRDTRKCRWHSRTSDTGPPTPRPRGDPCRPRRRPRRCSCRTPPARRGTAAASGADPLPGTARTSWVGRRGRRSGRTSGGAGDAGLLTAAMACQYAMTFCRLQATPCGDCMNRASRTVPLPPQLSSSRSTLFFPPVNLRAFRRFLSWRPCEYVHTKKRNNYENKVNSSCRNWTAVVKMHDVVICCINPVGRVWCVDSTCTHVFVWLYMVHQCWSFECVGLLFHVTMLLVLCWVR